MKNIDFNRLQNSRNKKLKKRSPQNIGTQTGKEKSATIIPLHAMLKNELKLYRGKSKSARLGVLRKYDELIAMARKSRTWYTFYIVRENRSPWVFRFDGKMG